MGPRHHARRAPSSPCGARYAAGIVALRPDRDGQIAATAASTRSSARYGEWVIDAHFPPDGHRTQPVEAGYMANAWVRMRHPDYDTLRAMLDDVGQTIHVYARVTSMRTTSCSDRSAS